MGSDIDIEELAKCKKVLTWNRRLLQSVGVWPLKVLNAQFVIVFIYMFLHVSLTIVDLPNYEWNLDMVITNVGEIVLAGSALFKIVIFRMHKNSLAIFLLDIEDDFKAKNYRSRNEIVSFAKYNRLSFVFIFVAIFFTVFATTVYYFRSLTINVKLVIANASLGYRLPYKTLPLLQINDPVTYGFYCFYQIIIVPLFLFGFVGYDSFFITSSLHVTGQLSVLNHRVRDVLREPQNYNRGMKSLIIFHKRLIRLADRVEDDFNIGVLQHLIVTMFNICMNGYNTLVGSSSGQIALMIIFMALSVTVFSTLFIYCYVGECLTQESIKFSDALYDSEWYNISPSDLKLILICMLRANQPLQLTSGKFCVLSLCTFTDIMKTSFGYMSVMRTFMN